jgi:Coenzyme Q (ubiquinone) biosynthesis protein Coq4
MLRLTRSALALSGSKSTQFVRQISASGPQHHEARQEKEHEEEKPDEACLDEFTREFLGNQIKVSDFQRILLTAGSSIAALLDPRRQDMIACLGETTGEEALEKVLHAMQQSTEGQQIMKEKPRINTSTVNLNELKDLAPETFGYHYYKFLSDNVSPLSDECFGMS